MDHPFRRWVELARPHTQLWRTLLGGLIVLAAWIVWTLFCGTIAVRVGLTTPDALGAILVQDNAPLTWLEVVVASGVAFATFGGIWLGVWAATKWVHRRRFATVLAHDGRIHLDQFAAGG